MFETLHLETLIFFPTHHHMQTGISRNIPTCTCIMIMNGILSKTVNVVHNQLETRMTNYTLQIKTIKPQLVYTVVVRGSFHKSLELNHNK